MHRNRHSQLAAIGFCLSLSLFLCPSQSYAVDAQQMEDSSEAAAEPVQSQSPEDILELEPARQYMLNLINKDRASLGLSAVAMDETAQKAGQPHADEMAERGYLAHWGLDGKKPTQRYTEAGGNNYVMENAHIIRLGDADEDNPKVLQLTDHQRFSKKDLEEIESDFFNEKPPNDGHRRNIIDPDHTHVGVALSLAGNEENYRVASTQEFVNRYGNFSSIDGKIKAGAQVNLQGHVEPGLDVYAVDVGWEDWPKSMTIKELNATYSYNSPDALVSYWPAGWKTPVPIVVSPGKEGQDFSLELPFAKTYKPGLYYITIWAKRPKDKEAIVVSERVIEIYNK